MLNYGWAVRKSKRKHNLVWNDPINIYYLLAHSMEFSEEVTELETVLGLRFAGAPWSLRTNPLSRNGAFQAQVSWSNPPTTLATIGHPGEKE